MNNPLATDIPAWISGLKLLGLAGFSYWFYSRVNKHDIFMILASALAVNGVFALIFLSGEKVGAFGIILNTIALFAVFTALNAIFCSQLYLHLPAAGIDEELLVDPDKGIQFYFVMPAAFVLLIVLRIGIGAPFLLVEKGLRLGGGAWILYLILSAAAGFLTTYIMPLDVSRDTFVTVQSQARSVNVFEIKGELSPMEKAGVPVGMFVLFFMVPFLMKPNKEDADYIGFFIVFGIFASFVYLQFFAKKGSSGT